MFSFHFHIPNRQSCYFCLVYCAKKKERHRRKKKSEEKKRLKNRENVEYRLVMCA
jgi:hypothetical protein